MFCHKSAFYRIGSDRFIRSSWVFLTRSLPSIFDPSTSFGWGKGGNVPSAGWQGTLCDPMWHVSSRSGVATCELLYTCYLLTYTRYVVSPGIQDLLVRSSMSNASFQKSGLLAASQFFAASLLATAVYWQVRGAVLVLVGD